MSMLSLWIKNTIGAPEINIAEATAGTGENKPQYQNPVMEFLGSPMFIYVLIGFVIFLLIKKAK